MRIHSSAAMALRSAKLILLPAGAWRATSSLEPFLGLGTAEIMPNQGREEILRYRKRVVPFRGMGTIPRN